MALKIVKPGTDKRRYALANVRSTIAMKRLAAGKRDEAQEQFKQCVATNTIRSFDYELGRA